MVSKARSFLIMNNAKSTRILVEIVDDEEITPPLARPNGEKTGPA